MGVLVCLCIDFCVRFLLVILLSALPSHKHSSTILSYRTYTYISFNVIAIYSRLIINFIILKFIILIHINLYLESNTFCPQLLRIGCQPCGFCLTHPHLGRRISFLCHQYQFWKCFCPSLVSFLSPFYIDTKSDQTTLFSVVHRGYQYQKQQFVHYKVFSDHSRKLEGGDQCHQVPFSSDR